MITAEKPVSVDRGTYVDFEKYDSHLIIRLNARGREELAEWDEEEIAKKGDLQCWWDLCEWQLLNGWEIVRPEQVGDLRDEAMLTITDEGICVNDQTNELIVGTAWFHNDYCFELPFETLREKGWLRLERHDYLTSEELDAALVKLRAEGVID